MGRRKIVIMGAAGRDFHNFLVRYRDDPSVEVVSFTASQIPGIENRRFPPELAGDLYPRGIPIFPEERLAELIDRYGVHQIVFSYSDISHIELMHRASAVLAAGADFVLLGPDSTMLKARVPVISVCAVRTGCGKSGVSERIWEILTEHDLKAVVIRHPMPYSDLTGRRAERFASLKDLDASRCTVEEREEYEHLLDKGIIVYAGVDYRQILESAQSEADVLIWDGGNNDFSFVRPDLEIVLLDPHRPGHERRYHPGETNLLRANILVINKVDSARSEDVRDVAATASRFNPKAMIVRTASRIHVPGGERIRGKRVLVIEDGPTLTHGEMRYGAGVIAAQRHGASEIVDPRPYAVGSLRVCLEAHPHLQNVLPAEGYFPEQLLDMEESIKNTPCDLVLIATPIDLSRLIAIAQPTLRVTYRVEDLGKPTLEQAIFGFLQRRRAPPPKGRSDR